MGNSKSWKLLLLSRQPPVYSRLKFSTEVKHSHMRAHKECPYQAPQIHRAFTPCAAEFRQCPEVCTVLWEQPVTCFTLSACNCNYNPSYFFLKALLCTYTQDVGASELRINIKTHLIRGRFQCPSSKKSEGLLFFFEVVNNCHQSLH